MSEFERFEFRPWMGYVAGLLLFAAGGGGKSDVAMLLRGLGLTVFFGTSYWSHRRYRRSTGAGASVGELRSFLFALFCGLLTLLALVKFVLAL
jgi:hypothetical protein